MSNVNVPVNQEASGESGQHGQTGQREQSSGGLGGETRHIEGAIDRETRQSSGKLCEQERQDSGGHLARQESGGLSDTLYKIPRKASQESAFGKSLTHAHLHLTNSSNSALSRSFF